MKYANSLKYMNTFVPCLPQELPSQRRVSELCAALGRINTGTPCIFLPAGSAGHASSIMLEAVIVASGHTVGRITSAHGFDSRSSVFINGEIASIDDYNKAVAELKSAVQKTPDEVYTKEEVAFVLGLLLCRMADCRYIILEGLSGNGYSLDAVCAPYDLIVMPTLYGEDGTADQLKMLCDAVKRGTREVVSGNQRSEIYNKISNACVFNGIRLYIPVKAQFETVAMTSRHLDFDYGGRTGYSLRSPSHILRDCSMTVIESALALRRGGVRMPWNAITSGMASTTNTSCFDIMSISPIALLDSAETIGESELMLNTADEVFGKENVRGFAVCIPESATGLLDPVADRDIDEVVVVTDKSADELGDLYAKSVTTVSNMAEAANRVDVIVKDNRDIVCLGGVTFICDLKNEILKILNN